MLRKLFIFFMICCFLGLFAAVGFVAWGYHYITRDLPNLKNIEDYRPPAVTRVLADDGTPIAEFYEQRRYPIKIKDVPILVRNCFLAAEDANFYTHPGIDPMSIVRALVKNIKSGAATQGGSTITQQVVKNMLLTPEKNIERKIKEAILSYQLEQRFSKDEILEIYLNQIFFGNTAYGLKAAALVYFHKQPSDLTLGEAAILAAMPKAPSRYSPVSNFPRAKKRQRYVLDQMVKAGFVTDQVAEAAYQEKLEFFAATSTNIFKSPYYVSEIRRIFSEDARWKGYSLDTDGLIIETALNLQADQYAANALRSGLKEIDKRRGWRGPLSNIPAKDKRAFLKAYQASIKEQLEIGAIYPALVTEVDIRKGFANVDLGYFTASINLKTQTWAQRKLLARDEVKIVNLDNLLHVGDVIEVTLRPPEQQNVGTKIKAADKVSALGEVDLDQTPEVEGAVVMLDPLSGKVVTVVGGYSYQRSVFNRATQSFRQPGSAFKPVIYLAAVDGFNYTPSTIVYDTPRTFRVGDEFWTPGNFDEKYMGAITLRTALEKSRNLVSADIISRIGIDAAIQYAKKLGIESKLGRNLSLSLGSSEVTPLELVRSYGVFPAKGVLFPSVFITKITDRNGKEIYNYEAEKLSVARKAINENSAFIMANLMKGVVDYGTGSKVKELKRPVAGKTGTSNDQMDAWFIGYTPNWVCGVWIGFDVKKTIGDKETGGKIAAPIFLNTMKAYLDYLDNKNYQQLVEDAKAEAQRLGIEYVAPEPIQPLDFSVPDGVDPFWVNKESGLIAEPESQGAILEYFVRGTEPLKTAAEQADTSSYLESPDL